VTESFINGWRAVRLVTDAIEVTVLPGKGADIFAITDLATGIDPLLQAPCRTIVTPPMPWEDSARLEPAQRSDWPKARLRAGREVDLWHVPGLEAASHDDAYLTELDGGWAEVSNPALRMAFRLDWDPALFKWIISWQPFGGAQTRPLRGAYGLGIEPWTTGGNLEAAVAAGDAIELPGGGELTTRLTASSRAW
jgi:hypothetical protein